MKPLHALAAAALALGGAALPATAGAAPKGQPGVTAGAAAVIEIGHRDGDREWRRDGRGDWDGERRWRRDGDHRRDWRDDRHGDGDWHWDRGRHLGWERGWGHDRHWHDRDWDGWRWRDRRWHDDDWKKHKHWGKKHRRWHARHHRHHRWVGYPFPRVRYVVIRDYDYYYLPPPPFGHFYARVDDDVFLVAEATKRIIDAFVLLDAAGRY